MKLSERIKDYASQIGLANVGIIDARPLDTLKPFLKNRVQQGLVSPFEESNIARRIDPRLSLPGCMSIICLSIPYLTPPKVIKEEGPWGQVARIARGEDYHVNLQDKARQILDFVKKTYPHSFDSLVLIDKGPLLERAFFRKAGGSTGENTTSFSPYFGSWIALGLILLTINLEPLPLTPSPPDCLHCGACRKACPTGALFEPYQINAWQCLSYLTQSKGIISPAFREKLGARIYGCDTCQEVCPLNKDLKMPAPHHLPQPVLPEKIPLIPFLEMNKKELLQIFAPSSAGWRGHKALRRNMLIALGNSNDNKSLEPLSKIINEEPSSELRIHAAWSLGQLEDPRARKILVKRLGRETDEMVQKEIITALDHAIS